MDIFDLLDAASLAVNGKYKRRKDREKGFWHWLDEYENGNKNNHKDVIRVTDDYLYGTHVHAHNKNVDVTVNVCSNSPIEVSVEVYDF